MHFFFPILHEALKQKFNNQYGRIDNPDTATVV